MKIWVMASGYSWVKPQTLNLSMSKDVNGVE